MIGDNSVLLVMALVGGNYYLTTFSMWLGHWSSHLKTNPLASFHLSGHHVIYLNSKSLCSATFEYGHGKNDSTVALIPPLIVQALLLYALLPPWVFLGCLIQGTGIAVAIGYVHIQIHIQGSKLERFRWFWKARQTHSLHHDLEVNYMVADHFWDKMFRTYGSARAAVRGIHDAASATPGFDCEQSSNDREGVGCVQKRSA